MTRREGPPDEAARDLLRHHGDTTPRALRALGVDPSQVLDLGVNISPFGPSPGVLAAVRAADVRAYPDRGATQAREALGASLGRPADEVLLGNGAAELIWSAVRALVPDGACLLVLGPTFSEAHAAAHACGRRVVEVRAREEDLFEPPLDAWVTALARERPALVYVCHPNNPTGRALDFLSLTGLVADHPGTTFLVDQAFLSLSERHAESAHRLPPNALVVRSLTKDHALAGLRVAYALGAPALLARVAAQSAPWSVSSLALAAAIATTAPEAEAHLTIVRERWLAQRRELEGLLTQAGLAHVPSLTVFGLVRVPHADDVRTQLVQRHGFLVRSCTSFGLPGYIRVRASDQNARFVAALTRVLTAPPSR
ncbi:MAG: histidinol-phosphate transaminase [Polyangiales bacterium]